MNILENISKIINLYTKWGASDYIGESITQIEHALQCAMLASQDVRLAGYDNFIRNCVIVAALLHDIGHLIGLENGEMEMLLEGEEAGSPSLGIVGHEGLGAAFLNDIL
jgi:predicted HD phosphohydrolase